MSSMTATLTPAHVGTLPSRFAVPTTSYWDTLQEVDRIACIDPHKSRKLGRKTGWFPAGALLKKWTEEIYPAITKIINDAGNYERIFGKHNKEVSRPCWLYMVGEGEQWMTARPTIVAICSKTRIAQRICNLLQNIACMRTLNLGFDYMHHKEKVVLVTGNVDPATLSNLPGNLCGLQVLASTYPASIDAKWTQTTVGGTLKINQEHYCLSVAHAFHLDASVADDSDSDSSSDTDNGSHEPDDLYSTSHPTSSVSVIACRPGVLENVDLGLYFGSGSISTCTRDLEGQTRRSPMTTDNVRVIGSGRVVSGTAPSIRSLLLCAELDWALVRISDPQSLGPNLVHTPSGTTLSPQRVSMKPPHGKVLVAAGVSGVFESYCPGIIGGLSLPGSFQMVDVWTIESLCLPGDCGSWVIDPTTGDIYGIIIATAPRARESYMVPAYQIYNSIKSKLPTDTVVEFPTSNDIVGVRAIYPTISPSGSVEPSVETVKKSRMDTLHSQADIFPTKDKSSRLFEWYNFEKRGQDWKVANTRRIRASQNEMTDRVSHSIGNVGTQMRAMDPMLKGQIDRLVELRKKHFCESYAVEQSIPISIEIIQIPISREKNYDERKLTQVLALDVILSISLPSDLVATPPQPPAPDPSKDRGIIPSITSPAPDEDGLEELDIWVITPLTALKMLCHGIDTLVRLTGDIPPTPPIRSRQQSPNRVAGSEGYPQFHSKENLTPQRSHSGNHEIDGVPFTKTPIGSPEAHISEPLRDVGADAEPTYIQHAAIARRFYSKRPPPITTKEYLLRIHKYCPMSTAVYLATSLYINRMAVAKRVISVTPRNVHRLLLAGLRVAMKVLEDLRWPHERFSRVGGISEIELGRLEIAFCVLMNFELRVDAEMLQAEVNILARTATSAVQDSPNIFEMQVPSKGEKRKPSSILPTRPAMPPEVHITS